MLDIVTLYIYLLYPVIRSYCWFTNVYGYSWTAHPVSLVGPPSSQIFPKALVRCPHSVDGHRNGLVPRTKYTKWVEHGARNLIFGL